jgi:hypothetical protein
MASKDNLEYARFVAEKLVTYIDTPIEERRRSRTAAKAVKEPWLAKWFGWAPYGIILWWRLRKDRSVRPRG